MLAVEEVNGTLLIGDAGPAPELLAADDVVLAVESGALRRLAEASALADHAPKLAEAVARSGEAEAYAVVRWWFDRPASPGRAAFYTVADFQWTDSLAVYSAFQAPFTEGANAVVESHAYAIPDADRADVSVYAAKLLEEMRVAFPELADARVLHEETMAQDNFTRFAPGDAAHRPGVKTEVPNLFLAGDHVQLPFPAFLMEAAAASGRIAANHILADAGVVEDPIRTVALRGQLADVIG